MTDTPSELRPQRARQHRSVAGRVSSLAGQLVWLAVAFWLGGAIYLVVTLVTAAVVAGAFAIVTRRRRLRIDTRGIDVTTALSRVRIDALGYDHLVLAAEHYRGPMGRPIRAPFVVIVRSDGTAASQFAADGYAETELRDVATHHGVRVDGSFADPVDTADIGTRWPGAHSAANPPMRNFQARAVATIVACATALGVLLAVAAITSNAEPQSLIVALLAAAVAAPVTLLAARARDTRT